MRHAAWRIRAEPRRSDFFLGELGSVRQKATSARQRKAWHRKSLGGAPAHQLEARVRTTSPDQGSWHDAFPWPIHYDSIGRDVWLPARLRPPAVLERALVLCSGRGPEVNFLSDGGRAGDRRLAVDPRHGRLVGSVSLVYEKFLPGHWLRYGWVPFDLASKVAGLLACSLEPFASVAEASRSELNAM